jgi:hypothetical protein
VRLTPGIGGDGLTIEQAIKTEGGGGDSNQRAGGGVGRVWMDEEVVVRGRCATRDEGAHAQLMDISLRTHDVDEARNSSP